MLDHDFYPTPPKLISRLLAGIHWSQVATALEPSAGRGDIADRMAKMLKASHDRSPRYHPDDDGRRELDCIELDPDLRNTLKGAGYRVVHDDFLTYQTRQQYDLIAMNPPFSAGARHLLKALELVQYGGQVRCLLNAETIRNFYTNERKDLVRRLDELGATITYHAGAFSQAEVPTDVEVALISVTVPARYRESIILEDLHKAQQVADPGRPAPTEVAPGDFVEAIVSRYRFEVDAGVRLIHEYERIRPHLLDALRRDGDGHDFRHPILELTIDHQKAGSGNMVNGYIRLTRLKYWQALFEAPQFTGQLTSNLRRELAEKVATLADFEFSRVNILSIQRDMSTSTIASIEETILKQFDALSREHSWDKDSKNVHYYDGWCTNKSWKINEKVILPFYGWDRIFGRFDYRGAAEQMTDIEKCLTFLNGGLPPAVSIASALTRAKATGQSSGIESSFFTLTLYKKGTAHIRFLRKDLLNRLNIFGSQRKGWLPPSYGKRRYADMDPREQAVVDAFEGQDAYAKVVEHPEEYIIETESMLRLAAAPTAEPADGESAA